MGDPHGDPQNSPQHADPHVLLVWFSLKSPQEIHVDRRVVGWPTGRHVDHPCGGQISPWPARKVTRTIARIWGWVLKQVFKICRRLGHVEARQRFVPNAQATFPY